MKKQTGNNKKLLVTSASLLVTSALLVVTRSYLKQEAYSSKSFDNRLVSRLANGTDGGHTVPYGASPLYPGSTIRTHLLKQTWKWTIHWSWKIVFQQTIVHFHDWREGKSSLRPSELRTFPSPRDRLKVWGAAAGRAAFQMMPLGALVTWSPSALTRVSWCLRFPRSQCTESTVH